MTVWIRRTAAVSRWQTVLVVIALASACQRGAPLALHQPFTVGQLSYTIESAELKSRLPYPGALLQPPPPDRIYLIVSYTVTNRGQTTVDLGLPPFEVRTEDGRRFQANPMLSMLYPMERAESRGSLQAMSDAANTQLHPALSKTNEVAFALTTEVARQPLSLVVKGPWLGLPETTVTLK